MNLRRSIPSIWRSRTSRRGGPVITQPGPFGSGRRGLFFLLPSLLGVCVFVLIPFGDVLRRSFTSAIGGQPVGLRNYRTVFENEAFRLAALNTGKFLLVCMPLLLVLSLLVALILYAVPARAGLFKTTFLIPMAIPVASVVLLWQVVFHRSGLLSGAVDALGGTPQDWMNAPSAFWVLVGSYIWKNLGYDVILWLAGLAGIPPSLAEAARVDGAGSFTIFFRITLPNLLPSLYTILVLSLLNAFKVFREAWLVAGDYPHQSIYLLQHLFNNWFRELAMDKLAAAAVVVAASVLILILLLRRAWDTQ